MAICHGILSIYFNHTVMLDVLRRFTTNIHKVGDFHCYEDNGLVFLFHLWWLALTRILFMPFRLCRSQDDESNRKKRHFAFFVWHWWWWERWWWRWWFYLLQCNTISCHAFSVNKSQTKYNKSFMYIRVNHRACFNELIQRNLPLLFNGILWFPYYGFGCFSCKNLLLPNRLSL